MIIGRRTSYSERHNFSKSSLRRKNKAQQNISGSLGINLKSYHKYWLFYGKDFFKMSMTEQCKNAITKVLKKDRFKNKPKFLPSLLREARYPKIGVQFWILKTKSTNKNKKPWHPPHTHTDTQKCRYPRLILCSEMLLPSSHSTLSGEDRLIQVQLLNSSLEPRAHEGEIHRENLVDLYYNCFQHRRTHLPI